MTHDTPEEVEAMAAWHGEGKAWPSDVPMPQLHSGPASCPASAAMLRRLHQRAVDAERERDGANALVERMHSQDVLAIKAWQNAHPGNDLTWPDQMRLTAWCMGSVAQLVAERDIYRGNCTDALAENDALRFERNNLRAALATARADALREGFMLAHDAALTALSPSDGAVYAADMTAQWRAHHTMMRVKARLEEAADANGIQPTTTGET